MGDTIRGFVLLSALLLMSCVQTIPSQPVPAEYNELMSQMDAKQREANYRARFEFVSNMPLRHMFVDRQVQKLAQAAGRGRIAQIDQLVAQGVDVNTTGELQVTPLYWPLRRGNVDGFKKLLELGADPNVIFADGTSVMFFVAQNHNLEFLRLALEHGADPNLISGRHLRRAIGDPERRFVGETPLFHVVIYNRNAIEAIDMLLEYGADINAHTEKVGQTDQSTSVLMSSTSGPRFDVTLHLLERGADYTFANGKGNSLITRVAFDRRLLQPDSKQMQQLQQVVDWLAERGVDIPESR